MHCSKSARHWSKSITWFCISSWQWLYFNTALFWSTVIENGRVVNHFLLYFHSSESCYQLSKHTLKWFGRLFDPTLFTPLNPFSASQLSTTNFSLYNTYKIWHLVMRNENWSNKANYWRLKVKFSQICSMKSMGSGWENLKIQLALKGLNNFEVWVSSFLCTTTALCDVFAWFSCLIFRIGIDLLLNLLNTGFTIIENGLFCNVEHREQKVLFYFFNLSSCTAILWFLFYCIWTTSF